MIALQNTKASLFDIAYDLNYPDGFALSNQMKRLADIRPSAARQYLGWEWVLECWMAKEARNGGFSGDRVTPLVVEQPRERLEDKSAVESMSPARKAPAGQPSPDPRLA